MPSDPLCIGSDDGTYRGWPIPRKVERRIRRRAFWHGFTHPFGTREQGQEAVRAIVRGEMSKLPPQAMVDNPAWVLEKYVEAKEIIDHLQAGVTVAELREDIEAFYVETAMDICTTLDGDCACNHRFNAAKGKTA